jgi:hypothetical protein
MSRFGLAVFTTLTANGAQKYGGIYRNYFLFYAILAYQHHAIHTIICSRTKEPVKTQQSIFSSISIQINNLLPFPRPQINCVTAITAAKLSKSKIGTDKYFLLLSEHETMFKAVSLCFDLKKAMRKICFDLNSQQ